MRYTWGRNVRDSDTGVLHMDWSVILLGSDVAHPERVNVVLHGKGVALTEFKAKAIAMILNAEEPH